jgi:hypothetical protein
MMLSDRKGAIRKDSTTFFAGQADHKSFIFPTTKKCDRTHYSLLERFRMVGDDEEDDTVERSNLP